MFLQLCAECGCAESRCLLLNRLIVQVAAVLVDKIEVKREKQNVECKEVCDFAYTFLHGVGF